MASSSTAPARAPRDYEAWARHNRMAQSFTVNAGHAWQTIIAQNRAVFDRHPEYRALVKGKRQGEQLCVSNPTVRRLAVQWTLDFFKKNTRADMVSLEPSDGNGQCECESCRKLGSISDRVFGLASEVARAVAKEYPGRAGPRRRRSSSASRHGPSTTPSRTIGGEPAEMRNVRMLATMEMAARFEDSILYQERQA